MAMNENVDDITSTIPKEFDNWEEEQIGLPPYWNAEPGDWFAGIPLSRDEGDQNFNRYIVQATKPVMCRRGPKENAEPVPVAPGEFFSLSTYAGLPLDRYMGCKVLVVVKDKRKLPNGHTIWEFALKVDPATKKLLDGRRLELAKAANEAFVRMGGKTAPKQLNAST